MNEPTPLTDAAKKLRDEYISKIPDNLWSSLQDGDCSISENWVKNAPPDGWEIANQLERLCASQQRKIEELKKERDEFHRCMLAREESLKKESEAVVRAKTERDEWKRVAGLLDGELERIAQVVCLEDAESIVAIRGAFAGMK